MRKKSGKYDYLHCPVCGSPIYLYDKILIGFGGETIACTRCMTGKEEFNLFLTAEEWLKESHK